MGASWELLAFAFRTLQHDIKIASYTTHFIRSSSCWLLSVRKVPKTIFQHTDTGPIRDQRLRLHDPRPIDPFLSPLQKLCGITARRFGLIFVLLDIVAFLVQLAGVSLASKKNESSRMALMGLHLYMVGIGLQEAFILGFTALTIHLQRKLAHMEEIGSNPDTEGLTRGPVPWRWLFYIIYFALSMITVSWLIPKYLSPSLIHLQIRIIFRIGQCAQGLSATNAVLIHEAYDYIFDAVSMFLALASQNIFHPGRILRGPES